MNISGIELSGLFLFAIGLIAMGVDYAFASQDYVGDLRFNNDGTTLYLLDDDIVVDEIELKEPFNVESIKIQYSMKYMDNGEYKSEPITQVRIKMNQSEIVTTELNTDYRTDSNYVFPIHLDDLEVYEERTMSIIDLWKENIPYNLLTVIFWIGLTIFILLYLSRKMRESEVLNV